MGRQTVWRSGGLDVLDRKAVEVLLRVGRVEHLGEAVAQVENRRAGFDLTFSMPKSASVMAYVAGDKRILAANMAAVHDPEDARVSGSSRPPPD